MESREDVPHLILAHAMKVSAVESLELMTFEVTKNPSLGLFTLQADT